MTAARRTAVLAACATIALAWWPATDVAAGIGWTLEDVAVATGQDGTARVTGVVESVAFPGRITQVSVELERVEQTPGCEDTFEATQTAYPDNDLVDDEEAPEDPEEPMRFAFDVPFSFADAGACNGTYTVTVVGTVDGEPDAGDTPEADDVESPPMEDTDPDAEPVEHVVAAPPPDVAAVLVISAGRTVRLGWQPPAGYGPAATSCTVAAPSDRPDFSGYVVQRETAGAWVTLPNGTVPPGTQCLEHQEAAEVPSGSNVRYRVLAVRDSPSGPVTAAGGSTAVATVVVDPPAPTTTAPATATTRTPGTSRSIGGGGGRGGPAGGTASGTVPPVPADGTYDEELDYGEPGEEAAVVPDDADAFLDFVPSPGPGILVPFAIAECLAVWAFHLRYLARRADDGF